VRREPSPDDNDDRQLLSRIAAGEQLALRRLMDRHSRGIRLLSTRYLGNAHDAEDVAQEVFVSVWKHARRYDPAAGRPSTWLYRIAANRCIDLLRWRRLRSFVGLEQVEETLFADEPEAGTIISSRQELAIVRAGLAQLPDRQRMALLLRAVADMDVPAIAEVMGTSAGSVEQLLVRARRALRNQLPQEGSGEDKEMTA
jgi:RNA polymerase sigma-70 factor (ECF subfamily)